MNQPNALASLNDSIAEFVNRPENRRLRPGTGHYSALFRGSLFGLDYAADVARELTVRRVDVLWLGMNPNLPRSLAHIVGSIDTPGDYPMFERQRASGFYAARRWSDHRPLPDWNPLQKPRGGWGIYRELFSVVASLEAVTMANFLPWGSANARSFMEELGHADLGLLWRAVDFADELNAQAVEALSPRLLVVPFSLGKNSRLDRVRAPGVSMSIAEDVRTHDIPKVSRRFTVYTGRCRRGGVYRRTVYLPHPSSLKFSTEDRVRIIDGVAQVLLSGA